MSECYGCGKTLSHHGSNGYFWFAGEVRSFCPGRSFEPKKPCVTKAFFRLAEERLCPLCGEGWSGNGSPCSDCEETMKVGHETRETTLNLQDEVVSTILASFLRFDSCGGTDPTSWPFRIVTREGDDRLSRELRRCVHALWEAWGKLHHARGLVEGSNMLARLQSGEVGLAMHDAFRKKAVDRIPITRAALEKLTLEVVEQAKKIQEWNDGD